MGFWLFAIVGILFILDSIVLLRRSKMNWGLGLTMALGTALLFGAIFDKYSHPVLTPSMMRILAALSFVGVAMVLCMCLFLFAHGKRNTATFYEDAVIILGASVRKGRMSLSLQYRLDKGIEYALRNSKSLVVVSGGIPSGETVAEADVMAQYLTAHGVEAKRLVIENRSKSTLENFALSKAMLDERLGTKYQLAFITSCFHVYRAGIYARKAGFHAQSLGANTGMIAAVPCYLREMLAVLRLWILNY